MADPSALTVTALTSERLSDLQGLFGTSKTTSGCYCTWFILPAKQCQAGWSGGNRVAFEERARAEAVPMGLLAYADGQPVGWCAAGPRSRYARALRAKALSAADPAENDLVWLVPCFFVRTAFRHLGVMRELLDRSVELAAAHGASAVEGFPLAGDKRRGNSELYVGAEPVFAARGFTVVDRPTPSRVVMRLDLASGDRASGAVRRVTGK